MHFPTECTLDFSEFLLRWYLHSRQRGVLSRLQTLIDLIMLGHIGPIPHTTSDIALDRITSENDGTTRSA